MLSEALAFAAGIATTSAAVWRRSRILRIRHKPAPEPRVDEATAASIRAEVGQLAKQAGNPLGGTLAAAALINRQRARIALAGEHQERRRGRFTR
ncbi:MAG TPA: hypothetical protein VGB83_10560 [Actinomycetota bacterium]